MPGQDDHRNPRNASVSPVSSRRSGSPARTVSTYYSSNPPASYVATDSSQPAYGYDQNNSWIESPTPVEEGQPAFNWDAYYTQQQQQRRPAAGEVQVDNRYSVRYEPNPAYRQPQGWLPQQVDGYNGPSASPGNSASVSPGWHGTRMGVGNYEDMYNEARREIWAAVADGDERYKQLQVKLNSQMESPYSLTARQVQPSREDWLALQSVQNELENLARAPRVPSASHSSSSRRHRHRHGSSHRDRSLGAATNHAPGVVSARTAARYDI